MPPQKITQQGVVQRMSVQALRIREVEREAFEAEKATGNGELRFIERLLRGKHSERRLAACNRGQPGDLIFREDAGEKSLIELVSALQIDCTSTGGTNVVSNPPTGLGTINTATPGSCAGMSEFITDITVSNCVTTGEFCALEITCAGVATP